MTTLFIVSAVLGGALLALQLLMGIFGATHLHIPGLDLDHDGDLEGGAGDALNLFSLRALTAGMLFFGLVGLLLQDWGLGFLALLGAVPAGAAGTYAVALALRAMDRMETDGAEQLAQAVGQSGTVYLSIPGQRTGAGKIHLTLAGRLVECQAQAETPLPTGAPVLVVDVVGPDLVEVIPSPQIGVSE